MKSAQVSYWFVAAAWWAMMVVLGAMIATPMIAWASIWKLSKILMSPALILCLLGLLVGNPKRYLVWLATLGTLWLLPLIIVCLTPIGLMVYLMGSGFTVADFALLFFALTCLSVWFVAMRLIGDESRSIGSADTFIFFENGVAYLRFSDLQRPRTSEGGRKLKFCSSRLAALALIGYPLEKILFWHFGSAAVMWLISILATPIAGWLIALVVCKFFSWALPIWRYERTHGTRVYLKRAG